VSLSGQAGAGSPLTWVRCTNPPGHALCHACYCGGQGCAALLPDLGGAFDIACNIVVCALDVVQYAEMFDLLGCELAWRPELGTFAPLLGGDASASIQDIRAAGDCAGVTEEVCCGSRSRYRLRCRGRLELASRRHRCGAAGSVRHRVRDESSEGFGLSRISLNELVQFVARGRGELAIQLGWS
jgi:hypothetical protein